VIADPGPLGLTPLASARESAGVPLVIDLIRHGEALPAGAAGDDSRPLAPSGRAAIERLRDRLAGEGWDPDRVFSSPLLRARESAEILAAAARRTPAIEVMLALTPDQDPDAVLDAIEITGITEGHLVFVGHQPLLGRLLLELTRKEASLTPGTYASITCGAESFPGGGELTRILRPGELG
jgi:phosphohistidine phosphatase